MRAFNQPKARRRYTRKQADTKKYHKGRAAMKPTESQQICEAQQAQHSQIKK